jgi:hypothetical protein
MWRNPVAAPLDLSRAAQLWEKCLRFIYIEVYAKSLVKRYPQYGASYWDYTNELVMTQLKKASKTIILGYLDLE